MNANMTKFQIAATILVALGGLGLLALVLHAMTWAPFLILSSVSWNA